MINRLVIVLITIMAMAGPAAAAEKTPFPIGYLEIEGDVRYEAPRAYAGINVRPRNRPLSGAELALRDSKIIGRALGLKFSLERAASDTAVALVREMDRLNTESGIQFFLVDTSAEVLTSLGNHAMGRDILLFNVPP